jgi:type II secretory pathway pseudopilin PulG
VIDAARSFNMNMRNGFRAGQSGFTLVEALIALVVLSFGLLAIAQFQSKLVSSSAYNKARSEAIALAQKKLDELRSYSTEPELVANLVNSSVTSTDLFPDDVTNATYPNTAESINGLNAAFSRQWLVSGTGPTRDVAVIVSWDDLKLGQQQVVLNTELTWKNPRGGADLGDAGKEPLVPSATGDAELGDGTYDGDIPDAKENGDGTATLQQGEDLVLVDVNSKEIVLTLRDACDTNTGVCTDFVEISGTVYIDNTASNLTPDNIHVLASDAAYCATNVSDPVAQTATQDYDYFDYTCYLGGGWYGNIGLLLVGNGIGDNDRVCVGDPSASNVLAGDAWKRVQLAKRRVYRGMLYKIDDNGDAVQVGGEDVRRSIGIKDAAELPDSGWSGHTNGHDFVVTRITGSGATKDDCIAPLTRGDAVSGQLFAGVPKDFLCLNADSTPDDGTFDYLDSYDSTAYAAYSDCPYNPASPPSTRHVVEGTIYGNQDLTGTVMQTSDGLNNCTMTYSGNNASYSCNVYDWGSGWVGTVYLDSDYNPLGLTCDVDPAQFAWVVDSELTTDSTGNNLICSAPADRTIEGSIALTGVGQTLAEVTIETSDGDPCTINLAGDSMSGTYSCPFTDPGDGNGWTGDISLTQPYYVSCTPGGYSYSGLESSVTNADFDCAVVNYPQTHTVDGYITGNISDFSAFDVTATTDGSCKYDPSSGYYRCGVTDNGYGWDGTISVKVLGAATCSDGAHAYSGATAVTGDLTVTSGAQQDFTCESDGPAVVKGDIAFNFKVSSFFMTIDGGKCTVNTPATIPGTGNYYCQTGIISAGSTWSGTVTATSDKVICIAPGVSDSTASTTYKALPPNSTEIWNIQVESNPASCK